MEPVRERPLIFDVGGLVEWLVDRADELTREELLTAYGRVGRDGNPAMLVDLRAEGLIPADVLPVAVSEAWERAEFPEAALDPDEWTELFRECGYVVNGERSDPPAGPLTLYRGATEERRGGMAWTDDVGTARWFAERFGRFAGVGEFVQCRVWVATFQPVDLLARIHAPGDGRGEHEYVIDWEAAGWSDPAPLTS